MTTKRRNIQRGLPISFAFTRKLNLFCVQVDFDGTNLSQCFVYGSVLLEILFREEEIFVKETSYFDAAIVVHL